MLDVTIITDTFRPVLLVWAVILIVLVRNNARNDK